MTIQADLDTLTTDFLNDPEKGAGENGISQLFDFYFDDFEAAEKRVLESASYYFNNRWRAAPDEAQAALAALARGETVSELGRDARRWLQHRALIDGELRLRIPVLGRFLIEEELA